jgi:3-phenylpropionate/cinnamic acid dioxygenase small subunit
VIAPERDLHRDLRLEIEEFNTEYCAALDEGRLEEWPEFFTSDAVYTITGRENADANLPVGLVYCEGAGMLRDRVFALLNTAMYAPRYLLHVVGNARVLGASERLVEARANYIVLQTLVDEPATVHQAGRYFDVFERGADGRLRLKERRCVYDTLLVDNSLVLPV